MSADGLNQPRQIPLRAGALLLTTLADAVETSSRLTVHHAPIAAHDSGKDLHSRSFTSAGFRSFAATSIPELARWGNGEARGKGLVARVNKVTTDAMVGRALLGQAFRGRVMVSMEGQSLLGRAFTGIRFFSITQTRHGKLEKWARGGLRVEKARRGGSLACHCEFGIVKGEGFGSFPFLLLLHWRSYYSRHPAGKDGGMAGHHRSIC